MKQLSIGTKTAAYYSGYLTHATCYQDGSESVTRALDVSGNGNDLLFGAGLSEGTAWATPGQLAIPYGTSADAAVRLAAAEFNSVDFDAGDHLIIAAECQITTPAATTRMIAQGGSTSRCGIRYSIKTTGAVAPSVWTPTGQATGADSSFVLTEASPSAWSHYMLYMGAKGLDGAGILRYAHSKAGAMDASVYRTMTGVGVMGTNRLDDLYIGGYFEFAAGNTLAAKWRNIHVIRVPATAVADLPFQRVARLASRLARSPNLPVTAQELGQ